MAFVDGFVIPVPKKRLADYRRLARIVGKLYREHGAHAVTECVAADVKPGKLTSFPQAVKLKPGETVIFAWIVHRSRAARERTTAKVMNDPRLAAWMKGKTMPFDGKRMILGGFTTIVAM
jgi:uncharacterized protein YbaA (DUF1428 family)